MARLYDKDGSLLRTIKGSKDEVDISGDKSSIAHMVIHNHPSNKTFSNRDLLTFAKLENAKIFTIVKNNGMVEVLKKNDDFKYDKFLVAYGRYIRKYRAYIDSDIQNGYNKVVDRILKDEKFFAYSRG